MILGRAIFWMASSCAREFGLPHGLDRQTLVVITQAGNAENLHAFVATLLKQPQLVVCLEDASHAVNEVANLRPDRGSGWSSSAGRPDG